MGTIDERIVKLSFDNKGFESGIQSTLKSLDALNKTLDKADNSQAAKNLSKSLKDIKIDGIEKIAKNGVFSKIGDSISNIGTSFMNMLRKLDFTGIVSKITSGFSGATQGTSALANGVDTVAARFSHLQVVAATALANITNRMINAGMQIGKALTIDPIKDGFSEYETKMNAMQTIFANTSHKGTTYDDIVKALDELNEYSDKTIYNFGQMTDNIGKFTAAGVDLDTSVSAIKGLANLAAMSGVDNARAQGVMYQASQALSKGYFQLMDWRSFSNNGMGNDRFKQLLIETSDLLGTGASAAIEAAGSFDDSLTKSKWLTNDVMNEALKMLAGYYTEADLLQMGFNKKQAANVMQLAKQAEESATQIRTVTQLFDTMKEAVGSGWAKTWEWIIGDKEQATTVLTDISNAFEEMIKPGIEARNKMFEEWNKGGGRDTVIDGFKNIFGSIGKVAGSIKDAFQDIFPPMTSKKLIELSNGFKKFTENLKVSDKTAAKIKDTFKGVFSMFDLAKTGITSIFKAFSPGVGIFGGLTSGLLTITSTIGKFFTAINNGVKSSGIFDKISTSISKGITNIGEGFNKVGTFISGLMDSISLSNFKPIFDFVGQMGSGFGKGIVSVLSGIGEAISNVNLSTIFGALTMLFSKGVFDKIKDIFSGVGDIFDNLSDIGGSISDILSSVTSHLKAMTLDVNASTLLKIAGAVGILAVSLQLLSSIDSNSMNTAITGLTSAIVLLVGAFAALMKIQGMGSKEGLLSGLLGGGGLKLMSTAAGLLLFSSAILVLAGAIKTLSKMKPAELMTGLAGVAGSMLVLVGAAKLLDGVKVPLVKAGASMILVAAALNVMASAVKKFAEINPNNMLVGLMGIAATLVELAAFMKLADFGGLNVTSAVGLLGVAAALIVLQNAVSKFGSMDLKAMGQGLLGIAAGLGIMAGFSHLAGSATSMLVMAAALVVMGAALHVLSSAVRSMAGMDWMDMARGLTVMAGSLAILAAAVRLMSGVGLLAVGAGLVVASAGLILLSAAMKSLAEMSWEEMARGLVAMAGGLLVLGVAAAAMSGMVIGAGALLILAAAMAVLTPQLIAMSNLSWGQVAVGLTMLAGAMVVLGIAGVAAVAIAPGLAILAASILLLGVGCLAAGAGVTLFATGLATLAAVGAGGMFAITEAIRNLINLLPQVGTKLGEFITNMAVAFAQGIPQIANAIGQAMVGLLESIRTYGPQIVTVGTELIVLLCNALSAAAPQLANAATTLILALINALASSAGQIASAGADLVIGLLDGLSSRVGDIVQAGIDLAISLLEGIADGINSNADRIGSALEAAFDAALNLVGVALKAGFKALGGDAVSGFADGVSNGAKDVGSAIKKPIEEAKKTAKTAKSEFKSAGEDMVKGLADGIKGSSAAKDGITKLVDDAVNKAKNASSKFTSAGKEWANKLASGIKSGSGSVNSAVASVINSAVSKARAGNGQMRSAGASMMDGFAAGIRSRAASAAAAAASAVTQAIAAAKSKLQINSPSKVFMQIGKWTVMGMEKGLDDNAYRVANSASGMADSAINAMQSSISMIANAVNNNIDVNPTIRPVLDLSNVEAGARSLNGMLDNSQLSASLSGDMSRSIGTIQNGNNNGELLSAIKDLQGNVGNSGDTYQINGITYDDGSAISSAVQTLIRAAKIERRM